MMTINDEGLIVPGSQDINESALLRDLEEAKRLPTSAATLCRNNCQLIGYLINRNRSAGKKNRD